MAATLINTCVSGECAHWRDNPHEVVIHTHEDLEACERLFLNMGGELEPLCKECRRSAREYENEREWLNYQHSGGWMATL